MPVSVPVPVKGVAVQDGAVLLLENERPEWELPGGKLGLGGIRPTAWCGRSARNPAGR
ncbi:MAG TPA: hypothetical protein VGG16_07700 [Streptosporangiaceae bacterium]